MMATGKESFDASGVLLAGVAMKKAVPVIIQPVVEIPIKDGVPGCVALGLGNVMGPCQVYCCVYVSIGGQTIRCQPLLVCYCSCMALPCWSCPSLV